ncbi:hypothetical protein NC652_029321 [Populus alba x Populus x berolinensis]|nr:hypothetical protein NC652_029321 [Populus alba x Populus x berolinensis]
MTLPKRQKLLRTVLHSLEKRVLALKSEEGNFGCFMRALGNGENVHPLISAAIQGEKWHWPPAGSNKLEAVQSAVSFLIHPQLVIIDSVSRNPGSDGQFPARSAWQFNKSKPQTIEMERDVNLICAICKCADEEEMRIYKDQRRTSSQPIMVGDSADGRKRPITVGDSALVT